MGAKRKLPSDDDRMVTFGDRVPKSVSAEFGAHCKRHRMVRAGAAAAALRLFIRTPLAFQIAAMDREASQEFWDGIEAACKELTLE